MDFPIPISITTSGGFARKNSFFLLEGSQQSDENTSKVFADLGLDATPSAVSLMHENILFANCLCPTLQKTNVSRCQIGSIPEENAELVKMLPAQSDLQLAILQEAQCQDTVWQNDIIAKLGTPLPEAGSGYETQDKGIVLRMIIVRPAPQASLELVFM